MDRDARLRRLEEIHAIGSTAAHGRISMHTSLPVGKAVTPSMMRVGVMSISEGSGSESIATKSGGAEIAAGNVLSVGRPEARKMRSNTPVLGDRRRDAKSLGATSIILLDLGLDAATIRSAADVWQDGSNEIKQCSLCLLVGVVDGRLNNVVGERVTQHLLQFERMQHFRNQTASSVLVGGTNAFLDDVGAEFLAGKGINTADHAETDWFRERRLAEIENVLDNVVPEWILHKSEYVSSDRSHELTLLDAGGVINAALEYAAAVAMSSDSNNVSANGIDDELNIVLLQVVEAFLDDVVTIEILNELHDLVFERSGDHVHLLLSADELDHFLQGTRAVLIQSNSDHVISGLRDECSALIIVGVFK